jgi:hypothetical protein
LQIKRLSDLQTGFPAHDGGFDFCQITLIAIGKFFE